MSERIKTEKEKMTGNTTVSVAASDKRLFQNDNELSPLWFRTAPTSCAVGNLLPFNIKLYMHVICNRTLKSQ